MFKNIWQNWKVVAAKIGDFQARLIFSILYYLIITPFGIIISFFNDYFNLKSFPEWHDWENSSSTLNKLKEQ